MNDFLHSKGLRTLDLIKLLADQSPHVVVVTDADLNAPGPYVVYTNAAYEGMTGYKPEEAVGNSPRMLQGERTNKIVLRQLSRALRLRKHARAQVVNYRKNGESYICDIAAWPVLNEAGDPVYFLAIEREIKRKRGRPVKDKAPEAFWENDPLAMLAEPQSAGKENAALH